MVASLEKRWTPALGLERSWYSLVFMCLKEVVWQSNSGVHFVGSEKFPSQGGARLRRAILAEGRSISKKAGLFLETCGGGFRPIVWAGGSTESRPTLGCWASLGVCYQ
jgi:hypothetical protein